MFASLADFIVSSIDFLWPLKQVSQWEMGNIYWMGKYRRTVKPGWYIIIPWFMKLIEVSVVPGIQLTELQTVTLRDGRQLTFRGSVTFIVDDPAQAINGVERYAETLREQAAGVFAEILATVDPARFDPKYGRRDRLLEEIRDELNQQVAEWGLSVRAVRFPDFAIGLKTYRLLTASTSASLT